VKELQIPLPIKIIALVFVTISTLVAIVWVITEPAEYEPWTILFGGLAIWIVDFFAILNDLSTKKGFTFHLVSKNQNSEKIAGDQRDSTAGQAQRKIQENSYEKPQETKYSAWEPFYYIFLVLISGTVGAVFIALITLEYSEALFFVLIIPAIIGAVASTLFIDVMLHMREHPFWVRMILALFLGILGAIAGLLITTILAIAVFISSSGKSPTSNLSPANDLPVSFPEPKTTNLPGVNIENILYPPRQQPDVNPNTVNDWWAGNYGSPLRSEDNTRQDTENDPIQEWWKGSYAFPPQEPKTSEGENSPSTESIDTRSLFQDGIDFNAVWKDYIDKNNLLRPKKGKSDDNA
jgi:hypothetical protein